MPPAARLGDTGSGHGCFPPTNATSGSPDVFINGKPAVRVSDSYAPHGCGNCAPHGRALAAGSPTVFINGLEAGRIGDPIDCGGVDAAGSPDTLIGGQGTQGPYEGCMQAARRSVAAFVKLPPMAAEPWGYDPASGVETSPEAEKTRRAARHGKGLVEPASGTAGGEEASGGGASASDGAARAGR